MHNANYTREELISVVCAIAGRAVYAPGAWASAPSVVAEAVAVLEEVDRVWSVNAPPGSVGATDADGKGFV